MTLKLILVMSLENHVHCTVWGTVIIVDNMLVFEKQSLLMLYINIQLFCKTILDGNSKYQQFFNAFEYDI